jgi:hypothetical protein
MFGLMAVLGSSSLLSHFTLSFDTQRLQGDVACYGFFLGLAMGKGNTMVQALW